MSLQWEMRNASADSAKHDPDEIIRQGLKAGPAESNPYSPGTADYYFWWQGHRITNKLTKWERFLNWLQILAPFFRF